MKTSDEISGWFNYKNTFNFLLSTIPDNGKFVECGAWLGASSAYLCDVAKDRVQIFIVDSWKGSDNELNSYHSLATVTDIYPIFLENMGDRKFTSIRKLSVDAARDFEDNSCDVVYIDMNHSYESVKQDIESWFPKVKHNGYIAGHDFVYGQGVQKAVHEFFDASKIVIMDENSWIYRKV
jgi:hypothetical protein